MMENTVKDTMVYHVHIDAFSQTIRSNAQT